MTCVHDGCPALTVTAVLLTLRLLVASLSVALLKSSRFGFIRACLSKLHIV